MSRAEGYLPTYRPVTLPPASKRSEPRPDAKTRPIYDLLAELPGVESSAAEIAGELGEDPAKVLEQLRNLWVSGYVQKTGPRKGRKGSVRWFVQAQSEVSHA